MILSTLAILAAVTVQTGTAATADLIALPEGADRNPAIVRDCTIHLSDGRSETVRRCGEPFQAPDGEYKAWLERPAFITPYLSDLSFPRRGDAPVQWLALLAQAGEVRVTGISEGSSVRLFDLDPETVDGKLMPLFERTLPSGAGSTQMPIGAAIGAVMRDGTITALSRPARVTSAQLLLLQPRVPDDGGDLLVELKSPQRFTTSDVIDVRIEDDRGHHRADVIARASDRIVAVWYSLQGRTARLTLSSDTMMLPPTTVPIRRGRVAHLSETLRLLPALDVLVSAPEGDESVKKALTDASLTITRAGSDTELRRVVPTINAPLSIRSLPADVLEVALSFGKWRSTRRVDLSSGADGRTTFTLQPITISGRVFHADDPARAQLRIINRNHAESITTDDAGMYEFTVWQPGRYQIDIQLADPADVPPFSELLRLSGSKSIDFRIPRSAITVRVTDRESGKTIKDARVAIRNEWSDPVEQRRSVSHQFTTDERGLVLLPPLRPGTVEIRASATGFKPAAVRTIPVDAGATATVDIGLERTASAGTLRLLLPDGSPAAGAAVSALTRDAARKGLWSVVASGEGVVDLPQPAIPLLLFVRHPRAASSVHAIDLDGTDRTLRLPSAGPPLVVKLVDRDGAPVAGQLTVWFGEIPVSGPALSVLTGVTPPRRDGIRVFEHLPAEPLRVLATRRTPAEQIYAGRFESLATLVPYPRAAMLTITVAD